MVTANSSQGVSPPVVPHPQRHPQTQQLAEHGAAGEMELRAAGREGHQQHRGQQQQQRQEVFVSTAGRELLAGFAAGAANVTSGYPFDTVKVRLQSAAPGRYRGALHCATEVVRSEGVRRGLFRGLSSPLVGGTAETGVNYLVYSRVLAALTPAQLTPGSPPPLECVAAAGAVAGVALSGILGPTELVKCRMQQAGSAARYPGGPLQCLREVVAREGGLRGLTRGLGATLTREVPGNALFFTAYEALRRNLPDSSGPPHGSSSGSGGAARPERHWLEEAAFAIFCGGAAGTLMWAVVLPIDVAKTRLQTAQPGSEWDVGLRKHWAMLWREGGMRSLYAGLTPTLVRAFPANACQWLAWELAMRGMRGDGEEQ
ncbi:hypothetical protein Agub_g7209 [Astrephomene gubernaculifera]|uniref:Uncharacterized protein n=1 Tax=Astrephomene gubernaculifera TaxID=47775 RepID=A0AAD3HM83_9CHLO|nr:hypothetical protein Agub_g7209 [Astrephomene gubernaculifera]